MYINGAVLVEDQLREFLVLVLALQDLSFLVAPFAPKDTSPKHQPSKKKENQEFKQNTGGKFSYSFAFKTQQVMQEEQQEREPHCNEVTSPNIWLTSGEVIKSPSAPNTS